MRHRPFWTFVLVSSLLLGPALLGTVTDESLPVSSAFAAKGGKKKMTPAELDKALEELNKTIDGLLVKIQSRLLFSPEDSGQLADIQFKLQSFRQDFPNNPQLARPLYQAGILLSKREQPNDALDLFEYLVANYADNPYALKAKLELEKLQKQLGLPSTASASAPSESTATGAGAKK